MVKIVDLTIAEIYEMGQKSQSCRSWDSALDWTTIPPPSKSLMQTAVAVNSDPAACTSAPSSQRKSSSSALKAFSCSRAPVL